MVLVSVMGGLLALMAATMFALDVGMFMVGRAEAQTAADAGALSGAVALVFDNFDDRSASGPAVQSALVAARSAANPVIGASVSVEPADVTFPALERIRVLVHRTGDRGNPLVPFIGSMFGITEADVTAVAIAEAAPANAATCIKPWAIPDKWEEVQTPAWDEDDTFDVVYEKGKNKGQPLPNPDIYIGVGSGGYTGYSPNRQGPDYGRQVLLKAGNPSQAINAGHFYPIALSGGRGGSWYEENILGCWPDIATIGDEVDVEPGNMTGPTAHGTEALIDLDPGAYWDDGSMTIVSEVKPSPRVVVVPVFDPNAYEAGRQSGRTDITIANFISVFIEDMQGNNVVGRLVPATGLVRGADTGPAGSYLRAIRLVQ